MNTHQSRKIQDQVATLLSTDYFLDTDKMQLFKSTFTPGANSVLADFTANVVNFTGYNPFILVEDWLHGVDGANDGLLIYDGLATFTQTDVIATDIAGGWYIIDTAGGELKAYGLFDDPMNFDRDGNQLLVKPSWHAPITSDADAEFIEGP